MLSTMANSNNIPVYLAFGVINVLLLDSDCGMVVAAPVDKLRRTAGDDASSQR